MTQPAPGTPIVPPATAPTQDPQWLKPRLEQQDRSSREDERQKLLTELGITDVDAAKKALEHGKTAAEKLKDYETKQAEEKAAKDKEMAARMLIGLTDVQQQAVKDLAGDDPKEQVKIITKLTPTWAKEAAAGTTTTAPPATTPAAPPANSAPPANAPPTGNITQQDHKTNYATMRRENPFAAAQYGLEHEHDVYKPKT